jgi:hypothetical protein
MSSLDYIDICGPEPDTSNHKDLHRWDKWLGWFRRYSKHFPASNSSIDENGVVVYNVLLKSQRTRYFREVVNNKQRTKHGTHAD